MGRWLKILFQMVKVFILFTTCTILFYYGIMWINEEYQNYRRYEEPSGKAMQVSGDGIQDQMTWYERLILFYLNGE